MQSTSSSKSNFLNDSQTKEKAIMELAKQHIVAYLPYVKYFMKILDICTRLRAKLGKGRYKQILLKL